MIGFKSSFKKRRKQEKSRRLLFKRLRSKKSELYKRLKILRR
jgi:hypothetical protein